MYLASFNHLAGVCPYTVTVHLLSLAVLPLYLSLGKAHYTGFMLRKASEWNYMFSASYLMLQLHTADWAGLTVKVLCFLYNDVTYGRNPPLLHLLLRLSVWVWAGSQLWNIRDLSCFCSICVRVHVLGFSPRKKYGPPLTWLLRDHSSLGWVCSL